MQIKNCLTHPQELAQFICTGLNCRTSGIVCQRCLDLNHKLHQCFQIDDYFQLIRQNQCTDADLGNLQSTYDQMQIMANSLLSIFQTCLSYFKKKLNAQFQTELNLVRKQKENQKELLKLVKIIQESNNWMTLNSSILDMTDLIWKTQFFQNYQIVRDVMTKNTECFQNLESECPKLQKDIQSYFKDFLIQLSTELSCEITIPSTLSLQSLRSPNQMVGTGREKSQQQNIDHEPQYHDQFNWQFRKEQGSSLNLPNNIFLQKSQSQNYQSLPCPASFISLDSYDLPMSPNSGIRDFTKYQSNSDAQKIKNNFHNYTKRSSSTQVLPMEQKSEIDKEASISDFYYQLRDQTLDYSRRKVQINESYKQNEVRLLFLNNSTVQQSNLIPQVSRGKKEVQLKTEPVALQLKTKLSSRSQQYGRNGAQMQIQTLQNRINESKILAQNTSLSKIGEDKCEIYSPKKVIVKEKIKIQPLELNIPIQMKLRGQSG